MTMKVLHHAVWPVLLVALSATASSALLAGIDDTRHLDPTVWQTIVDRPDLAVPMFDSTANGET
jgi:hypothetical protein